MAYSLIINEQQREKQEERAFDKVTLPLAISLSVVMMNRLNQKL